MSPLKRTDPPADAGIDRRTKQVLDDIVERWEYVELELRDSSGLEAHTRGIVAALLVLADRTEKWGTAS